MQEKSCQFGKSFLDLRLKTAASQWTVAMRMQYHVRNIQRIEKGEYQPGVMLAVRMVAALEADIGLFFDELYTRINPEPDLGKSKRLWTGKSLAEMDIANVKCPFGVLFKQIRLENEISQSAVAKKVGYSLRNMNAVESGKQEPGVMTALNMVGAIDADICQFFNTLAEVLEVQKGMGR